MSFTNVCKRVAAGNHAAIAGWMMILLATCSVFGAGKDWTHYRGAKYDGIVPDGKVNPENLKELWTASVGTGFSALIVVDGLAYTMGNVDGQDQVVALDVKTGTLKWKHSYPCALDPNLYEGGPNVTPTYDNGKIYTLSKEGHIFCLDAKSGKVIWKSHTKTYSDPPVWGYSGAPTILNEMVIFNVASAGLALNKKTGDLIWKTPKGKPGYAPPMPFKRHNKTVLAMFAGTELVLVKPEDGKKIWSFPWKTEYDVNAAIPLIIDDKIFITSGYRHGGTMLEFNGDEPKQLWENKVLKAQFNSPVYYQGHIYGISGDANRRGKLVCMDPATGEAKWTGKSQFGSLLLAGDQLVILEERGNLMLVKAQPESFEMTFKKTAVMEARCWTVPTLVDGTLYLRDAQGTVKALDAR